VQPLQREVKRTICQESLLLFACRKCPVPCFIVRGAAAGSKCFASSRQCKSHQYLEYKTWCRCFPSTCYGL
jgi:hypothetical protein